MFTLALLTTGLALQLWPLLMLSVRLLDTSCTPLTGCEAARTVFVRLNDSAVAGLVGSARGGVQLNDARSVVTAIVEGGIVFGAAVDHQVTGVRLCGVHGGEHEISIGRLNDYVVFALVVVTAENVAVGYAAAVVVGAVGRRVVLGFVIDHHVAMVALTVIGGRGSDGWWLWMMMSLTRLSSNSHESSESESQWFKSHCRFHGVSPCFYLVG